MTSNIINSKNKMTLCLVLALTLSLNSFPIVFPSRAQLPPDILRGDIFVVSADHAGKRMVPTDFNYWKPGAFQIDVGHGLCLDTLFLMNVSSAEVVPALAESITYSTDYTNATIKLRSDIYWNDGVEFTADDVVYTILTLMNTVGLGASAYIQSKVQDVVKSDDYTVVVKFTAPNPKFHLQFTGGPGIFIMPKHIFETVEDILAYQNYPPIGTGPYLLKDYDPQGYWTMWERREDWEKSSVGSILGKPKPKYVLYIYYGDDDKEIPALARHELDVTQIGYESLDVARSKDPHLETFWESYPYAWMGGTSSQSMHFNTERYPYNITDVRWALALSMNITDMFINALGGTVRLAYTGPLAILKLPETYDPILLPWLEDFELSDGFKPWDPTVPQRIADYAENVLGETITGDPGEIIGRGWWKYDPEEAEKLLGDHGFYKETDGKWRFPNGSLWTMNVICPPPGLRVRVTTGVSEQWRTFGVEVVHETLSGAMYRQRTQLGDFDVDNGLLSAVVNDVSFTWQGLHGNYYRPVGEVATGGYYGRWVNDNVDNLLDEMLNLPLNDPGTIIPASDIMKILMTEMPIIFVTIGSKMIAYDTFAWTNMPTGDNNYGDILYWVSHHMAWFVLPNIIRTGNVPSLDIVIGPSPETIEEMQQGIAESLASILQLETSLAALQVTVQKTSSQVDTLMLVVVIEAVFIILTLVLVILRRR